MSGWQPIETAPRDGTAVLVYYEFATVPIVHIARWDDGEFWEQEKFANQKQAAGWWSYIEHSATQTKLEDHNTPQFWMPLPEPPTP